MMCNNPATSGVDMSRNFLRMFEAIDNVTMVKESTGGLSRMLRIDQLSGGRLPSTTAAIRWSWTRCGQVPPVAARPRRACGHGPASTGTMQCAQANCQEHKRFTPSLSRCWSSSWQAGWPPRSGPGLELFGAGVGDPRRPPLPLDDEVLSCAD